MTVFLPLRGRLKAVKILFAAIIAVAIAATLADVYELTLVHRAVTTDEVVEPAIDIWTLEDYLSLAQLGLYLVGALVWTRWIHRAYRNLDAIRAGARRFGVGWAAGAWFVPVLNPTSRTRPQRCSRSSPPWR